MYPSSFFRVKTPSTTGVCKQASTNEATSCSTLLLVTEAQLMEAAAQRAAPVQSIAVPPKIPNAMEQEACEEEAIEDDAVVPDHDGPES